MSYNIIYDIMFLPVIMGLGLITSYQDLSISKIKNSWVGLGLLYAISVYFLFWVLSKIVLHQHLIPHFEGFLTSLFWNFDKWCINLLISTLIAFFLWRAMMWGAGDAKLFIMYAALIPQGRYSTVYFDYYFVSFSLLVAIFLPATLFLIIKAAIHFIKHFDMKLFKKKILMTFKKNDERKHWAEFGKVVIGFFAFFLFFRALGDVFHALMGRFIPNQNILILTCLLVFRHLRQFFKKNSTVMLIAFMALVSYEIVTHRHALNNFVAGMTGVFHRTFLVIVLFPILRRLLDTYAEQSRSKNTPFAHWMLLGTLLIWFL